jgi:hypothetical protein
VLRLGHVFGHLFSSLVFVLLSLSCDLLICSSSITCAAANWQNACLSHRVRRSISLRLAKARPAHPPYVVLKLCVGGGCLSLAVSRCSIASGALCWRMWMLIASLLQTDPCSRSIERRAVFLGVLGVLGVLEVLGEFASRLIWG